VSFRRPFSIAIILDGTHVTAPGMTDPATRIRTWHAVRQPAREEPTGLCSRQATGDGSSEN
jgi:hypothetical protein